MKYHRLDEYHRPTDRSLLRGGYETPTLNRGVLRTASLLVLIVSVVLLCIFFS